MILCFPQYKNVGGAKDIFQINKRRCFPTQSTVRQWKSLSWKAVDDKNCHGFKKVTRQTHKRKNWKNTKTPILAQEAAELQIVRGWERVAEKYPFMLALSLCSSLNICYCLATVRTRRWTSGLNSMAIMFLAKSPKCEEKMTTENRERWRGLS